MLTDISRAVLHANRHITYSPVR